MKLTSLIPSVAALSLALLTAGGAPAATPKVGDEAADFTLKSPAGEEVRLKELVGRGPVVLVVLRGWPGYQCPICTRQVGELVGKVKALGASKARVVLVYPGPAEHLREHAEEFVRGKALPDTFHFVVDPDYTFTKSYGLRWDAPGETAYPSTFVIDSRGKVVYARSSHTHGDRAPVADVLKALPTK